MFVIVQKYLLFPLILICFMIYMVGSGTGYGSVQFYRFRIRPKGSDPDPQNCRKVSKVRAGTVPGTVKEIGLDTLEDRRKEADMVQVYKILSGKDNKDRTKLS